MRILVACEFSGRVRDAMKRRGHDAWSCDIVDSDVPGNHIKGDVLEILDDGWDMMIAHPPCTYLTVSGNKWMKPEYAHRFPDRPQQREAAIRFFMALWNSPIPKIAIENPVGIMSSIFRKPDQVIQPWQYGHPEKKATCLWLKNLPRLVSTKLVDLPTRESDAQRLHWLPPSPDRAKLRSITFQGIADAMADQWA